MQENSLEENMTDNEKNKLIMYESVLSFLGENRNITSNIRAFSWSTSKFRRIIEEIKRKEKEFSTETLEKTIITSKAKDELILGLVPVSAHLFRYAKSVKDLEIISQTRFTQTTFIRLTEKELLEITVAIITLAENKISVLKKNGVDLHVLQNLKMKNERYRHALENKVASYISSATVLAINSLFEEADKILNNFMDSFVEVLSDDYPEFYQDYLSVRNVEIRDLRRNFSEA